MNLTSLVFILLTSCASVTGKLALSSIVQVKRGSRNVQQVAELRDTARTEIKRSSDCYSSGIKRTYTGNGLPIWKWRFMAEGNQVAYRQETVHGGLGVRPRE